MEIYFLFRFRPILRDTPLVSGRVSISSLEKSAQMASPIDPNLGVFRGSGRTAILGLGFPYKIHYLLKGGIPNRQVLRRLEIPPFTSVSGPPWFGLEEF